MAHDTIVRLAALTHDRLTPLADPSHGYALLDFPDYSNIGDSLIWLGELAYFDRHVAKRAGYVSTTSGFDPDRLKAALPEGPVYLSGGGNFGDIWPRFQAFRLHVLSSLKGRRVVQLPQTILFRDDANIAATRAAIDAHGDFALMVRDQRSYDFATRELGCEVVLAPDMAFCMGPLAAPPPSRDATYLVRTDQEAAAGRGAVRPPAGIDALVTDWIIEGHDPSFRERLVGALKRRLDRRPEETRFRARAEAERARGMVMLGAGRGVVTDRLHAHILALLLGRPHVVVDNSYGKIGGVMDAWTGDDPLVHRAADFETAGRILADLLQR